MVLCRANLNSTSSSTMSAIRLAQQINSQRSQGWITADGMSHLAAAESSEVRTSQVWTRGLDIASQEEARQPRRTGSRLSRTSSQTGGLSASSSFSASPSSLAASSRFSQKSVDVLRTNTVLQTRAVVQKKHETKSSNKGVLSRLGGCFNILRRSSKKETFIDRSVHRI